MPHFGEIINERPEGMGFEKYKEIRRRQVKSVRERLKGVVVWKSQNLGTAVRKDIPIIKLA